MLRHVRDFERLSDRAKMQRRLEHLVSVFFESAIRAAASLRSFEFERHFLLQHFWGEPEFRFFDFDKLAAGPPAPPDAPRSEADSAGSGAEPEKLGIFSIEESPHEKQDSRRDLRAPAESPRQGEIFKSFAAKEGGAGDEHLEVGLTPRPKRSPSPAKPTPKQRRRGPRAAPARPRKKRPRVGSRANLTQRRSPGPSAGSRRRRFRGTRSSSESTTGSA